MNKLFVYIFAMFSVMQVTEVIAQPSQQHKGFDRGAYESRKNAFITAELKLTPEEAAAFSPLTNELEHKKFEASMECRKINRELRKKESPTDQDFNQAIDVCLEVHMKEAELEKEYYAKFRKILSPEKLYRYKNAEMKFARIFMKERNK